MDTQTAKITLTATMRKCRWFSGITAALTLFFFLSTFYFVPCAHAVEQANQAEKARNQYHPKGRTDDEKLANTLQDIKERVAEKKAAVHQRVEVESSLWQEFLNLFGLSALATEELDRLESMNQEAEKLNKKALEGFDKVEQDLIDKDLPDEILQRHYDAVEKYQDQYRRYKEKLQKARNARSLQDQDSALGELDEFMGKQQFKRSQQPFDPNNLPFGTPDPKKTREPVTDPQELNRLLGLSTEPGLIEKATDRFISSAYADPIEGPTSADLAETIDVKITDAVKDLAAQLDNNPVKIYNWVRNNIDFMPTYGSIQGSEATLESKRGNAFDTSSLLIALLRAANIPAKYAYATIRVPVDEVMNWVGGAEVPAAAQSVLSQGGIPNIARVSGGQVEFIDMEHIWVEAWVDFEPSRGANNIQGDSWVPLDASFKQYDYIDGIDIQSQVPFDAQGFADTLINSATIDETTGSVQNLDQQYIQDQMTQYQQQVEDFLDTQIPAEATVGDVLGKKIIQETVAAVLAASLPYEKLLTSNHFTEIPFSLRHKYRLTLQNDWGEDIFNRIVDLPAIAGSTLALSFSPATAADEQILERFIPDDITDISQLPQSLPGYLIKLKAEFVIDNTEQAAGGVFQMGEEVTLNQALFSPQFGWESTDSTIVAGEYHAIGVSGAGISVAQLGRLQNEIQNVQTILEDCMDNNNCGTLNTVNKHQYSGDILQTGILSWFALSQSENENIARSKNIIYNPLPSYGKFSTSAKVDYAWGLIPRNFNFTGFVMDVDKNTLLVEAENGKRKSAVEFARRSGIQSSIKEHQIPEQLFSTVDNPLQAISAIKAINIASSQGQRIYTLTQNNIAQLSNINIESDTLMEIRSALLAGKEVTVHDSPINMFGWTGSGYIIFDSLTGSGAYKISGGSNGGEIETTTWRIIGVVSLIGYAVEFLSMFLAAASLGAGFIIGGLALALIGAVLIAVSYMLIIEYMFHETPEVREMLCNIAIAGLGSSIGFIFSAMKGLLWGVSSEIFSLGICKYLT